MTVRFLAALLGPFLRTLDYLTPIGDLLARLWVGYVFLMAGINKVQTWDSTVQLFTYVYQVPLLSPYIAAVVGTVAELILPVLLVLGLGGRLCIFIFFVYNVVAMISYPFLWTPDGQSGLSQHISWGLLLALLMFHGPGKLSLDYLIRKHYGHHVYKHSPAKKSSKRVYFSSRRP